MSDAIRWGDLSVLSGRAAVDPATGALRCDRFRRAAADRPRRRARRARPRRAPGREHVLRVECWLADRADFAEWNAQFAATFPPPRPARTTLVVAGFPVPGLLVEVQLTAAVPGLEFADVRGRDRRRHRRPLLRLLPAPARRRSHRAGVQPGRQRRLLGKRRLDLPGAGRAAARARAHLVRASARCSTAARPSTSSCASCPQLTPWLLRFWTYCNQRDHEHGVQALARARPRRLRPGRGDARRRGRVRALQQGMLVAARDRRAAREELAKLQPMRAFGYELPDDVLDGPSCTRSSRRCAEQIGGGCTRPPALARAARLLHRGNRDASCGRWA